MWRRLLREQWRRRQAIITFFVSAFCLFGVHMGDTNTWKTGNFLPDFLIAFEEFRRFTDQFDQSTFINVNSSKRDQRNQPNAKQVIVEQGPSPEEVAAMEAGNESRCHLNIEVTSKKQNRSQTKESHLDTRIATLNFHIQCF